GHYDTRDPRVSVEVFRVLREMNVALFTTLCEFSEFCPLFSLNSVPPRALTPGSRVGRGGPPLLSGVGCGRSGRASRSVRLALGGDRGSPRPSLHHAARRPGPPAACSS